MFIIKVAFLPKGYDVDHTIDLQLGGVDDILNMNPLNQSINKNSIKQYPDGAKFDNFNIK